MLQGRSSLPGILQYATAPMVIDDTPFLDLLESSKAAQADQIIAEAAISYTRGWCGSVGITHGVERHGRDLEFNHRDEAESGQSITGGATWAG